jgi:non-heme chloroperoxidase
MKNQMLTSKKPTIFMIHGMWGTGGFWKNYKSFFEKKGYTCVTPTLPHHSPESDKQSVGNMSLLDYTNFLEKEISKLKEKPIIFGHSMGGLLAQKLAEKGLAEKIILITPASPKGIVALKWSVIKSFSEVLTTWNFWKKPHKLSFKKAVYSMLHGIPDVKQQEKIYQSFVFESGKAAAEIAFWKKAAQVDETKVTCPVYVIAAEKDRITPATVVRKVAKKYKNNVYKEFKNHSHYIVMEKDWIDIARYILYSCIRQPALTTT